MTDATSKTFTRRWALLGGAGALAAGPLAARADAQSWWERIRSAAGDVASEALTSSSLTEGEAADGIRAALRKGVETAVDTVSQVGGYLNDPAIRIPLPGFLGEAQSTLSRFGASQVFDDLETRLNRAAERAAPAAKTIFVDAVSSLTIQDALDIVRGDDRAATTFLQDRTTPQLTNLFTPPMENALDAAGVTSALSAIDTRLSRLPFAQDLGAGANADLRDYGVGKGLDGLFHYIGEEEAAIRANPAERTSDILRRVFGDA